MAGIYLHIPFCKQACNYCNFHFTTSLRYKDELITALIKEIEAEKGYLKGEKVNTIYFGGGTPSLLDLEDTSKILNNIHKNFTVSTNAEVTLEANPDDITLQKLKGWMNSGINRLSIGIQSFYQEELKWMNRAHNANQALQAVDLSREAGFANFSIDLIYGSPLLTDAMWENNVKKALELKIPHLSCYALTIEDKTPLFKLSRTDKNANVDNDKQARQFLLLMKWLKEGGYEHYEISNFSLPGMRSRHNSAYWKGEKYLGIGPSAHSYNGIERRWNVSNNLLYINDDVFSKREVEILTGDQQLNEYIMISLRTMEGIDLKYISGKWGEEVKRILIGKTTNYINSNLVNINNHFVQLTDEGVLMADGIASYLFV